MDVELCLITEDNSERFEMGKTRTGFDEAFYIVAGTDDLARKGFALPDVDTLAWALKQGATAHGWWEAGSVTDELVKEIAQKVTLWAKGRKVRVAMDCSMNDWEFKIPETGTWYKTAAEVRKERILILNTDLKAQWAPYHGGKCFVLSAAMGKQPPCTCHLCLIDELTKFALEG